MHASQRSASSPKSWHKMLMAYIMQGFAGLDFQQCSLALDGGTPTTSATCWSGAAVGAIVAAASPIPETLLGPTLFTQTLYDANPAVGGTGVGGIDIRFVCKYL